MAAFTLGLILLTAVPATQTYCALTFLSLLIIPSGIDMSFPATTIIMSNALPRDMQGIASSLVTTVVNYNVSLGLDFAATVEIYTNNGGTTPDDTLKGFKGAWYLGVDSAGLGSSSPVAYLVKELLQTLRSGEVDEEEEQQHLPSPDPSQLELSPTKKPALSLRTWPSQTNLAQRDSLCLHPAVL